MEKQTPFVDILLVRAEPFDQLEFLEALDGAIRGELGRLQVFIVFGLGFDA